MHRGFNFYYREGLKSAGRTIYRNKCFFAFILYFLAEFFGRILIVFNLHFDIANARQGYVVRKEELISFSSSFKNVGRRASVLTYLLALCLEGLIIIATAVAVALIACVLGAVGYGVSKLASYEDYRLFILMFSAPCAPILAISILVNLLIFSPTAYIIANNAGVSAGETIGACYRSMLNNGKMTVLLTYFVSCLLKLIYLGAVGVFAYFVLNRYVPEDYYTVALIGWVVVSALIYLTFAPILTLTNRVVKEHLFEDIVLDPATKARVSNKVNVCVCEGKKTEPTPQKLASLFEYTDDPYRILKEIEKKNALCEEDDKNKKPKERVRTKHVSEKVRNGL